MIIKDYCFCAVNDTFFTKEMQKYGCAVVQMYKSIPNVFKVLRKIHYKLHLPGFKVWLTNVPDNAWNKKIYIVYASDYSREFVRMIRKKTKAKIYLWYNNIIVTDGNFHDGLSLPGLYPTSFDEDDCDKYKMFHNTQYYFSSIELPNESIQYDVSCLCKDKGRAEKLIKLEQYLKDMGLRTYFHICKDATSSENIGVQYKPQVPYSELLRIIARSKVIFDLTQENQRGLTLRPMEAAFFKKKLITNNTYLKQSKIYNDNNICIIDINNPQIPRSFFDSAYEDIDDACVKYYDFPMWLSRFGEHKEK